MRQDGQRAVVDRERELGVDRGQLLLELRPDEQRLGERVAGAGFDAALESDDAGGHAIVCFLHAERVLLTLVRNDRGQEMMLDRRDPAVIRLEIVGAVLEQVVVLQLLRRIAVVDLRAVEGVRRNVEHRPLGVMEAPDELRVLIAAPCGRGAVVDRLFDLDGVAAALEAEKFLDAEALPVCPRERHDEDVVVAHGETRAARGERRIVARRRTQSGADLAEVFGAGVEQHDRYVGLVLRNRIPGQRRTDDRAARQADLHVEHVRRDVDSRSGRRGSGFRLRRRRRVRSRRWHRELGKIGGRQFLGSRGRGGFRCLGGRRGWRRLRAVVLLPGLKRQPQHQAEERPYEKSLIVHLRF